MYESATCDGVLERASRFALPFRSLSIELNYMPAHIVSDGTTLRALLSEMCDG
jgi:hypothetical protein